MITLAGAAAFALLAAAPAALAEHAIAQFGQPKYPAGFTHFDYVNPSAPKGGSLALSNIAEYSSFDTYNPFTVKGKVAPGVQDLVFETLTINSLDEVNTQYGLIASDLALARDELSITFTINPAARFSNGDKITADDVKYSFDTLTSKGASPRFRSYFAEIKRAIVLNQTQIRFEFARPGRDLSFVAGSLPVFSPKWGLRPDGSRTPFADLRLEPPIGSGPYQIARAASGSDITFRRDPNYWGTNTPARRGAYNFSTVVYKLYKDRDTQVAALRAADYDFHSETQMRYWCCQYIGKKFDSGEMIKEKLFNGTLAPMSAYVFNLRQPRFQDKRVRQAMALLYDWEWLNSRILDNEFTRQDSYFNNSDLAAQGSPSPAELRLLEPFRSQLDPAVFGPVIRQPTTTPPHSIRENMTKAIALLAQAGWRNTDGVLRNAKGEPFTLEVGASGGVLLDHYYYTLRRVGFVLRERLVDPTVDRARMRKFDFDMTPAAMKLRIARDPAPELYRAFHSSGADKPGSENIAGVKSPVVDALIEKLMNARTKEEQQTTARALDRVLLSEYYVLPWRYLKNHYIIYNRRLKRPAVTPLYFGPYEWVLAAWWSQDQKVASR